MQLISRLIVLLLFTTAIGCKKSNEQSSQNLEQAKSQAIGSIQRVNVIFKSEGVNLAGTIYTPKKPNAAVVIVHGSDRVPRMSKLAEKLAENNIAVLTYDKRGVGESEGIYAGPEVGTNNIDTTNLNLLAKDVSAAVIEIEKQIKGIPIGLIGASQAGWIMPIAANKNQTIDFMVLFSSPLITTLEQLRFQFYTDGRTDFWDNHSETDAREHTFNDADRYQFVDNDPKDILDKLSIPALWIFGKKDIQIPVNLCMEYIDEFKMQGKPFEYVLFPSLGHNTIFADTIPTVETAIEWITKEATYIKKSINN